MCRYIIIGGLQKGKERTVRNAEENKEHNPNTGTRKTHTSRVIDAAQHNLGLNYKA